MKKILILLAVAALFLSCGMKKEPGTIAVSGTGTVQMAPDTAQLNITVSERAQTTKEAQSLSNGKVSVILKELKESGVEDKNIATSAIRFSNDYVWNPDTRKNEIVGQIVSQTVTVKFIKLHESPDILASVLDKMGQVDGIEIGNLQFSIADPQNQYIEARRLAFEKAEQKASELAGYAGLKLGKALMISEASSGPMPYAGNVMVQRSMMEMDSSSAPSEIPGGEISISYEIHVTFEVYP